MAIQKFKMCLTVGVGNYSKGDLTLANYTPSEKSRQDIDWGRVILKEFEIEVDVPDLNTSQAEIELLETGIQKERADSQVRVNFLLDRISKLKAITHEVAE